MDTSYDQQDVVREYELLSANRRPRISIFNSSYLIHSKEYAQGKKKKKYHHSDIQDFDIWNRLLKLYLQSLFGYSNFQTHLSYVVFEDFWMGMTLKGEVSIGGQRLQSIVVKNAVTIMWWLI